MGYGAARGGHLPCKQDIRRVRIPHSPPIPGGGRVGERRWTVNPVLLGEWVRIPPSRPEQRKGNVRFGRCMVHIICLKHTNEGVVRFQWCSGAYFSGVWSEEDTPSLGRNKVLRLGACMQNKLLATLYAVVAQW